MLLLHAVFPNVDASRPECSHPATRKILCNSRIRFVSRVRTSISIAVRALLKAKPGRQERSRK